MDHPDASQALAIPFAESPLVESSLQALGAEQRELVRSFAARGYVVLDLDLPAFDQLASEVIATLAPHYPADERRIDEAWYFCPAVRTVASAPRVIETLRLLYGREPIPFQTLNFDEGTEQAAHSDTIHFHCVPRFFMCGVWVAFEDVDERNGPLFMHPGSHRLLDYSMTDLGLDASGKAYGEYETRIARILETSGLPREPLHLRKGQAVIWAANAYHGGSPILDRSRTRHSQATHYYFDDCLYYFPMGSEPFAGKVTMREVIDIRSGRFVQPRYCGRALHVNDYPYLWKYERPLPDWVSDAGDSAIVEAPHEDPDVLMRRIRILEETVEYLRADSYKLRAENALVHEDNRKLRDVHAPVYAENQALRAENALVHEDNRKKDAFIHKRNDELAYKIARRITKASRALFGRQPD